MTNPARRLNPRYLVRELEGEFVLLDLESGDYFTFEGAGNRAFGLFSAGKSEEEVRTAIEADHPSVPPSVIRADLDEFFAEIRRRRVFAG